MAEQTIYETANCGYSSRRSCGDLAGGKNLCRIDCKPCYFPQKREQRVYPAHLDKDTRSDDAHLRGPAPAQTLPPEEFEAIKRARVHFMAHRDELQKKYGSFEYICYLDGLFKAAGDDPVELVQQCGDALGDRVALFRTGKPVRVARRWRAGSR